MKIRAGWLAALCLLPAFAASAAQPRNITLRDAIVRAAERNPELAHFAFELAAQDARIEQAAQLPPLQVSAGLDDFAGTGASRWVKGAELTVSLSRVVELGGQAQRRTELATRQRESIDVSRQSAQLDTLAEVARRFIHVAADQQQLELTQLATRIAEETLAEVTRRVEAARDPAVQLSRARIVVSRARLEQEHAEHELLSSRRRLAAMWGDREPDFVRVEADLFRLPAIVDFDALARQLSAGPLFLEFASEARQREAELQLAIARARAPVTWSVGARRLQRDGDVALVAGFSMPLQSAQRAAPAIAEARARKSSVQAQEQAARVRAEASLHELVQELRHASSEVQLLMDDVMPQIEEAVEATRYAWERGRYSYLEWTEAQSERLALQRALIDSATNAQLFQVEIERLTGAALSSGLIRNASGDAP